MANLYTVLQSHEYTADVCDVGHGQSHSSRRFSNIRNL